MRAVVDKNTFRFIPTYSVSTHQSLSEILNAPDVFPAPSVSQQGSRVILMAPVHHSDGSDIGHSGGETYSVIAGSMRQEFVSSGGLWGSLSRVCKTAHLFPLTRSPSTSEVCATKPARITSSGDEGPSCWSDLSAAVVETAALLWNGPLATTPTRLCSATCIIFTFAHIISLLLTVILFAPLQLVLPNCVFFQVC
jgi:hypothetical protein